MIVKIVNKDLKILLFSCNHIFSITTILINAKSVLACKRWHGREKRRKPSHTRRCVILFLLRWITRKFFIWRRLNYNYKKLCPLTRTKIDFTSPIKLYVSKLNKFFGKIDDIQPNFRYFFKFKLTNLIYD